jgi:hypothetical protein
MNKYVTLLTVLDKIRAEAPETFKRYHPPETRIEELNNARARAFIHLFLKVKFGILDFQEREKLITDDPQDGGIDGYYVDEEHKRIYFVQSKFRTTESNFNEKEILFSELLQMDVDRIVDGDKTDEKGVPYNSKIIKMMGEIRDIRDIGRWQYEVIVLANVTTTITQSQLKRLSGGLPATVYNHTKVYQDLVFPVIQGTHYNPSELRISLNLSNTSSQSARVTYKVKTSKQECDITLVFVPTIEIARAMYKYRNSILKFNPRSYLELAGNEVNRDIASSITGLSTNEFALFNNGITILSFGTDFNEKIGQKDKGQLIVTQPQIINGGQTAFTLSRIYEDNLANGNGLEMFENKEVLLKVITLHLEGESPQSGYLNLIESISKATNQQSQVNEADRRSNDQIQIQLQTFLFDKYGWFYERKRGEYADGVRAGYVQRSQIIDRELFLRMCKCCDMEPSDAKRMSLDQLFDREHFEKTLNDPNRFEEYFFAYQCFLTLSQIKKGFWRDKANKFGVLNYGNGLSQGIYAIVAICRHIHYKDEKSIPKVDGIVKSVLAQWIKFERFAINQPHNSDYFRIYTDEQTGSQREELNFINYYKGRSLAGDLRTFFGS